LVAAAACSSGSAPDNGGPGSSNNNNNTTSGSGSSQSGGSTALTTQTMTSTVVLADGGTSTVVSTVTSTSVHSNTSTTSGGTGTGSGTGSGSTSSSAATSTLTAPIVITSAPNAYWNTSATITMATSGTATVTVNDGTAMQAWDGFGGAFNEDGWKDLSGLSSGDQTHAMKLLFDSTDGAHFVMGRIPIGASDYADTRYTEDEMSGDTALSNFSISRDQMYLIPYVQAAQAVNSNIKFWASPWTPPTWMKTASGTVNGTSCAKVGNTAFDGECMQDIAANLTALANYFVKWIQAYGQKNITISTLAPQNEPNYAQGYPSALWDPALYTKFIGQYLGPAFSTAGLSTNIMLGTMSNGDNGQQSKDLMVVTNVLGNSTAKGLVKVAGLQWGMLDIFEQNASWLGLPSGFPVWATEHKCGNYPWNPSGYPAYVEPAPNDQAYGVESWGYISKAIRAGVTAYNAWNMVLDANGKGNDTARQWSQDTLLMTGSGTCHGTAFSSSLCGTPAYFVFRHASQYVQPGAHVVATSGGDAIAFKNQDGSVVVAMYNSGSASSSYVVSIKGQKYQFSMPATGWATVVVP
jgi:glucosylceramidase